MKKTVYKKVIVFVKQKIEYKDDEDLYEKSSYMEADINIDLDNMQEGGGSEYDYAYEVYDATKEELLSENSILVERLES